MLALIQRRDVCGVITEADMMPDASDMRHRHAYGIRHLHQVVINAPALSAGESSVPHNSTCWVMPKLQYFINNQILSLHFPCFAIYVYLIVFTITLQKGVCYFPRETSPTQHCHFYNAFIVYFCPYGTSTIAFRNM